MRTPATTTSTSSAPTSTTNPRAIAWNSTTKTWVDPAAAWASFLPKLQWQRDFAIAHGKPVSYPEWGLSGVNAEVTSNVGGDNPTFIQGMYDWMNSLPANGPGSLEYHSYFNQDPDSNHRIDAGHFPNASARFQDALRQHHTHDQPRNQPDHDTRNRSQDQSGHDNVPRRSRPPTTVDHTAGRRRPRPPRQRSPTVPPTEPAAPR